MPEIYCKDCEHFDKCVRGYMPDCPVYYPKKGIMTNEQVKKVLYSFIDNNSTFFPKPIRDIVFSCDEIAGTERLRMALSSISQIRK